MGSNGGFMARAPGGKGKGHKYDLTGQTAGPGFKEPAADDPADATDEGEQDPAAGEFKSLTITPSDNGGFLIECEYDDDGSGNAPQPSTHTFEDAQGALDFVSQKLAGEQQEDQQDSGDGTNESGDGSNFG
jgi:hypothetical protein